MNPFAFPERIECPECGEGIMNLMIEGDQIHSSLSVTRYGIYHCEKCWYDHIIEKRWELAEVSEKQYFHG
jgi:C4-type Zn-finger protein